MSAHYYYTPVLTQDGISHPASVESENLVFDDDGGSSIVIGWAIANPLGARYFYDATLPRFVVRTPTEQTYSDWTEVTVDQVIADYGSEVV